MAEDDSTEDPLAAFIAIGIDSLGGAAGGMAGLVVTGPAGAVAGGIAGASAANGLRLVAGDFIRRRLSRREQQRAGTVFALTAEGLRHHLAKGGELRDDGFFVPGSAGGDRSSIEEIAEAVVLAAQRDPQERKLRYFAQLLVRIATNRAIDEGAAHRLAALLRELTWRQLELLVLFKLGHDDELAVLSDQVSRSKAKWMRGHGLIADIEDLQVRGIVGVLPIMPNDGQTRLQTMGLGTFLVAHAGFDLMDRAPLVALRNRLLLSGTETSPFE